ncbi:hypothetical protein D915_007125 [Fasciola hepatica]|uniref:Uncharacterized protein n=1 Tax=Fasciola hepatica TaxID=6192 RepID=A0A4E0R1V2_FASHE|nr:hypothetical protein D915_007125 [Fasciola hepatica]
MHEAYNIMLTDIFGGEVYWAPGMFGLIRRASELSIQSPAPSGFHKRRINHTIGRRRIWTNSAALQNALGCANARGASSNKNADSELGNRVVQ